MKWRPIPAPPPPETLLDERIGPHHVIVEAYTTRDEGDRMFRAVQIVGKSRSFLAVSAMSAEDALRVAAHILGYEAAEESST